jgi:hypothetical protein
MSPDRCSDSCTSSNGRLELPAEEPNARAALTPITNGVTQKPRKVSSPCLQPVVLYGRAVLPVQTASATQLEAKSRAVQGFKFFKRSAAANVAADASTANRRKGAEPSLLCSTSVWLL